FSLFFAREFWCAARRRRASHAWVVAKGMCVIPIESRDTIVLQLRLLPGFLFGIDRERLADEEAQAARLDRQTRMLRMLRASQLAADPLFSPGFQPLIAAAAGRRDAPHRPEILP